MASEPTLPTGWPEEFPEPELQLATRAASARERRREKRETGLFMSGIRDPVRGHQM